jgi:hypothetical protein
MITFLSFVWLILVISFVAMSSYGAPFRKRSKRMEWIVRCLFLMWHCVSVWLSVLLK